MRVEFVNEDERVMAVSEMPHAPRIGEKVRIFRPECDGAAAGTGAAGRGALFEVVDIYYWVPEQQAPVGEERLFTYLYPDRAAGGDRRDRDHRGDPVSRVRQAREKARQAQCQSNLKQMCHAFTLYLQDYDETL